MSNSFPDLATARLALLGESCEIANEVGLEYAVCGGWSPFLRNSSPISHPGTKDVDLLFADGVEVAGLKAVFDAFLKNEFLPSAKHAFQLIRIYSVGNGRVAFNVDLLHPTEDKVHGDMFVDHFELPVLEDRNAIQQLRFAGKSIAAPYSKFVFAGFVEFASVNCPRPDGGSVMAKIPLIDEVGVLVTKSESCRGVKRPRDLLDIYLAITQPQNREQFFERLKKLKQYHPAAFALLGEIRKAYAANGDTPESVREIFNAAGVKHTKAIAEIENFLNCWLK